MTFDGNVKDAFIMHSLNEPIKFVRNHQNICVFDLSNEVSLLKTVKDNKHLYTTRQIARAKEARKFLHFSECSSIEDLKKITRMNIIEDCSVNQADAILAEDIHEKDVESIEEKFTRFKPKPVVHDITKMPKELHIKNTNVVLCVNTLFVNEMPFLSVTSNFIIVVKSFNLIGCHIFTICRQCDLFFV